MFLISTVISLELQMHGFFFGRSVEELFFIIEFQKILCSQKYSLEYFETFQLACIQLLKLSTMDLPRIYIV